MPTSNAHGPRRPHFDVSVQKARDHAVAAAASGEYYRAHPDPRAALLDHVVAGRKGFLLENGGRRLTVDQKAALRKQLEGERARAKETGFDALGRKIPRRWNGAEWIGPGDPDGPGAGAEIRRKRLGAMTDSEDGASAAGSGEEIVLNSL